MLVYSTCSLNPLENEARSITPAYSCNDFPSGMRQLSRGCCSECSAKMADLFTGRRPEQFFIKCQIMTKPRRMISFELPGSKLPVSLLDAVAICSVRCDLLSALYFSIYIYYIVLLYYIYVHTIYDVSVIYVPDRASIEFPRSLYLWCQAISKEKCGLQPVAWLCIPQLRTLPLMATTTDRQFSNGFAAIACVEKKVKSCTDRG